MKIAYIVPSLAACGPVIVVADLVRQMIKNNKECTVFYFDDKTPMHFDCQTQKIDANCPINFTDYDIVHSHGYRPDAFVARFREYSGSVKYVTTIHNYVFQDFRHQYNFFVAQIFGRIWMNRVRKFDHVVTLSKDAMSYYKRILGDRVNVSYAYNTRDLDSTKSLDEDKIRELKAFKGENSILIGVNALLTKRKGVDLLIKSLAQLPQYKLFVVGEGKELLYLKKMALRCGVEDRCFFAGRRENAHLYLPFYDIFALPSRSEGFPLALLEAAIYSKKCVASNLPIIIEAFENEVEFFELKNPQSIVDAIKRASGNNLLPKLINDKFTNCYSPKHLYNKYIKIYSTKVNENK